VHHRELASTSIACVQVDPERAGRRGAGVRVQGGGGEVRGELAVGAEGRATVTSCAPRAGQRPDRRRNLHHREVVAEGHGGELVQVSGEHHRGGERVRAAAISWPAASATAASAAPR